MKPVHFLRVLIGKYAALVAFKSGSDGPFLRTESDIRRGCVVRNLYIVLV
jgi:hypothetical protein